MKTIFNIETREEIIRRIHTLNEKNTAAWGKMNVYQMLRHCTLWDEMILRNKKHKRVFIGIILGKVLLKQELKDESPMRKNNPTISNLKIKETNGDIEAEKLKWVALLNEYDQYSFSDISFVHPFFGKMTKEQIGFLAYKHVDHHLRQFNC